MNKNISYLNRTYADYKKALIEMSEKYYPDLSTSFNDSSIAAWQIDLVADVADNLSYHIDRVYQETNLDSAQEKSSLYSIARNNGIKIPGPKGAMAEMKFTITLPLEGNGPKYSVAPVIKRGTRVSSSSQQFELLSDIDFATQFNEDGISDCTITPNVSSNGITTGYTVSKLAVVTAGETLVYKHVVHANEVEPFMEIILPIEGVMNIESIIEMDGTDVSLTPNYGQFFSDCNTGIRRFYEVDSLSQSWCWADVIGDNGKAEVYQYGYNLEFDCCECDGDKKGEKVVRTIPTYSITKGEWKPVERKFITEYTDKGYLKIIFGAGVESENTNIGNTESSFSKWQMSKILNNRNLGVTPKGNSTIFILYRVGGGKSSNIPAGAINNVSYLVSEPRGGNDGLVVLKSLKVTNTTSSVSGKDMPTEKELKYYIKYHNAAQQRCVTVKDYIDRILLLPPKYGTPFRVGASEENNKIVLYLLGINSSGKLDASLPTMMVKNIEEYLSGYRMVNDYVEIKAGRIINISFDTEVIIDKNYNKTDVLKNIISTIVNYMDINNHLMGEDIYVGDLEKEINYIDGVVNLISLKIIHENDSENGYSETPISQETYTLEGDNKEYIDLEATDGILYSEGDSMFEIKYPERDVRIRYKER